MESQAKNGSPSPLIRRRVEASIVCLDTPPQTEPADIGGGGDPELALLLQCRVTQYIRSGRGRGQRHVRSYRGGVGAEASFVGTVPRDTPLDEDNIRGVIWGLLRDIRPLHDLDLTDAEWEAILPEDVVPRLAGLARGLLEDGGGRVAAVLELEVNCHVRYNVPRVLLTACRETATPGGKGGGGECSICFEALREEDGAARKEKKEKGVAVELPGCAHAFHRRCISKWFRKKWTCPLCRGDVAKHLDPDLRKHLEVFSDDDDLDPRLPSLLDAPGDVVAAAPPCDP
ncbi:unnamed protein product [Urochloa humidicola]